MDRWMVALLVFGAVVVGMIGQGWASLLEHNRRKQALEVIKAALLAGKEAPPIVYAQLAKADSVRAPWSEVVVFSALGFGFWLAFAQAEGEQRTAFLVIAATMSVTAIGCLALAILRPGRAKDAGDDDAG